MQVRGKTVYLQYSNRQEIVNAKNTADTPSNVLLVSLENLMVRIPLPDLHAPPIHGDNAAWRVRIGTSCSSVSSLRQISPHLCCQLLLSTHIPPNRDLSLPLQPDVPITLDVLHLVFSAFGFVHKIATFEKQAGLQALVQFDDTPTAEQVHSLACFPMPDTPSGLLQVLTHIEKRSMLDTSLEELVELAAPFGSLVQSKLNVGPNRNQAFIEFPDQPTAIAMCNYFNGSADPAKVRTPI
jgi:hypothetical protein